VLKIFQFVAPSPFRDELDGKKAFRRTMVENHGERQIRSIAIEAGCNRVMLLASSSYCARGCPIQAPLAANHPLG
jgi:hypothetical protein